MADIKLFVCCHNQQNVPKHPILFPIQVGAALTNECFPNFLYDDTGDNISEKNKSYCELTAQYWAWKNVDADYYGFFHYRRYLYPKMKENLPYRIEKEPTIKLLESLGYQKFADLIANYDIIAPKAEEMHQSVYKHYSEASFHHIEDLRVVESIIEEIYPQYISAMQVYLKSTKHYFGNIFIMRKEVFCDYCEWLFSILEQFDQRINSIGASPQEMRVDGYIGERLFGIYYSYHKNKLRVVELPRVHFYSGKDFCYKSVLNIFLPPGSKFRSIVKQFVHKWRKRIGCVDDYLKKRNDF